MLEIVAACIATHEMCSWIITSSKEKVTPLLDSLCTHLFSNEFPKDNCPPFSVSSVTHLIGYVHKRLKPPSQNFRTQDLRSKSIGISRMQRTNYLSH
jgi:hypothetical protein